jgi:hypothetical protein
MTKRNYDIPREIFENLGLVIANWNRCEDGMVAILREFINGPNDAISKICALLTNDGRADLLNHCVKDADQPVRMAVCNYLSAYKICQQNRNLIVHAHYYPDMYGEGPFITKHSKGKVQNLKGYPVSTEKLSQLVEDCKELEYYRVQIWSYLYVRNERNWDGMCFTEEEKKSPLPTTAPKPTLLMAFDE